MKCPSVLGVYRTAHPCCERIHDETAQLEGTSVRLFRPNVRSELSVLIYVNTFLRISGVHNFAVLKTVVVLSSNSAHKFAQGKANQAVPLHTIKAQYGLVQFLLFLLWVLDEGEWLVPRLCRFIPRTTL
jgi:hypothetical protein